MSTDSTPGVVTQERRNGIALVTLDDGKANALSHGTLDQLEAALDAADGADALVLAGRPGKFCAGFDLSVVQAGPDAAIEVMDRGAVISTRLHEWPVPRVFAVTGHALAMGAVLLACADLRIGAAGEFKFGLNEVAIGLAMPEFAIELLRNRLDQRQFHSAIALSKIYDTEGALDAGFLDEVVDPDDVVDTALAHARRLADGLDARAFARTRRTLDADVTARLHRIVD